MTLVHEGKTVRIRPIEERDLATRRGAGGAFRLLVTDRPGSFAKLAGRFLGRELAGLEVEQVDL